MSLLAEFPSLTGPYDVGCHDIEWGPKSRRKRNGQSVFLRLYYPASVTKQDKRAPWLSHKAYAQALCDIAHMPAFIGNWLSSLALRQKIRAYLDARVLHTGRPFSCMIFSHGLGGNRHLYSSFCSDMASHGFVVAAIEHRDRSASLAKDTNRQFIPYNDQPPEVWDYRLEQLDIRLNEVELALQAIQRLNQGRIQYSDITKQFKGRINMKSLVMSGHSFGGATSMLALSQPHTPFQCGLLLDPWVQPLITMPDTEIKLKRPVIAILSEQFSFWPDNFESVQEFLHSADRSNQSVCLSLMGTEHQHQSDVLLVLRYWSRFDFRSPFQIDPVRAMGLNTETAVAFIRTILKNSVSDTSILDPTRVSSHIVFH